MLNRRQALVGAGALAAGATIQRSAFAQGSTPVVPVDSPAGTPIGNGQPNDQMQMVLDVLASFKVPPIESVTPYIARNLPGAQAAAMALLSMQGQPSQVDVGSVEHILIPGLDDNQVLVRLYRPANASSEDPLPVLV